MDDIIKKTINRTKPLGIFNFFINYLQQLKK